MTSDHNVIGLHSDVSISRLPAGFTLTPSYSRLYTSTLTSMDSRLLFPILGDPQLQSSLIWIIFLDRKVTNMNEPSTGSDSGNVFMVSDLVQQLNDGFDGAFGIDSLLFESCQGLAYRLKVNKMDCCFLLVLSTLWKVLFTVSGLQNNMNVLQIYGVSIMDHLGSFELRWYDVEGLQQTNQHYGLFESSTDLNSKQR